MFYQVTLSSLYRGPIESTRILQSTDRQRCSQTPSSEHFKARQRVPYSLAAFGTSIEIVIGDDLVDRAIDAIRRAAQTGRIGDGKIFVSNIEEAIRIRTGESGLDAI